MIFCSISWEDWSHWTDWMGMKTPCLGTHSGSLKKTLVAQTHNLGAPGAWTPVRQQPWFRHIYIDSMSATFIALIPEIFVIKVANFATSISKVSIETQSFGIHDVHLFNTELAMHYRTIFNCGCERLRLCCSVLVYISRNKSKTGTEWKFFSV